MSEALGALAELKPEEKVLDQGDETVVVIGSEGVGTEVTVVKLVKTRVPEVSKEFSAVEEATLFPTED
jgi:hypothetical protein